MKCLILLLVGIVGIVSAAIDHTKYKGVAALFGGPYYHGDFFVNPENFFPQQAPGADCTTITDQPDPKVVISECQDGLWKRLGCFGHVQGYGEIYAVVTAPCPTGTTKCTDNVVRPWQGKYATTHARCINDDRGDTLPGHGGSHD